MDDIKKLKELRKEIDEIDKRILDLLDERGRLVVKIGKIKRRAGIESFSPEREKEIFEMLEKRKGFLSTEALRAIYREILSSCRRLERPIRVCYLGPEGSFTHQAANIKFGSQVEYRSVDSIEDVFAEVEHGRCDYGVVPVESSLEGMVTRTLDMFIESNNKINSEILLPISHCLLSNYDINSINIIYSHPQAIAQCRGWIKRNLPLAEIKETSSTSEAARIAAKEKNSSAIASSIAAKIYNLNIIDENIQDRKETFTRFLVISKNSAGRSGNDKTSIMFSIQDRVGALYEILKPFAMHGINLTKIESRPSKRGLWDYYFFVDFEGHKNDKNVKEALNEIKKKCVFLKILGSYPKEL